FSVSTHGLSGSINWVARVAPPSGNAALSTSSKLTERINALRTFRSLVGSTLGMSQKVLNPIALIGRKRSGKFALRAVGKPAIVASTCLFWIIVATVSASGTNWKVILLR